MASEKSDPNPFSFKTFMKRGEGPPAGPSTASGGAAQPTVKKSKKKSSKTSQESLPFPDVEEIGGKKSEDNPFSFTKFVERKSSKKPSKSSQMFTSSSGEDEDNSLTVVNLPPPPSTSPAPPPPSSLSRPQQKASSNSRSKSLSKLPSPQSSKKQKSKAQKKEISIFDENSEGSDQDVTINSMASFPGGKKGQNGVRKTKKRGSSSGSSSSSATNSPEVLRRGGEGGKGAVLAGGLLSGIMEGDFVAETAEIKKLRVENERLQGELAKSQNELNKQTELNAALKSKIKVLEKKEAEDAKALEDMVLKVESNLVTTTKRAASAEATIVKLKQEMATLQAQLAKSTPQAVHQHYEEILRGVREKSTYASQQLATASALADKNIRELLSGAEMLKNVAEILQFVDRTAEVRTNADSSANS